MNRPTAALKIQKLATSLQSSLDKPHGCFTKSHNNLNPELFFSASAPSHVVVAEIHLVGSETMRRTSDLKSLTVNLAIGSKL